MPQTLTHELVVRNLPPSVWLCQLLALDVVARCHLVHDAPVADARCTRYRRRMCRRLPCRRVAPLPAQSSCSGCTPSAARAIVLRCLQLRFVLLNALSNRANLVKSHGGRHGNTVSLSLSQKDFSRGVILVKLPFNPCKKAIYGCSHWKTVVCRHRDKWITERICLNWKFDGPCLLWIESDRLVDSKCSVISADPRRHALNQRDGSIYIKIPTRSTMASRSIDRNLTIVPHGHSYPCTNRGTADVNSWRR